MSQRIYTRTLVLVLVLCDLGDSRTLPTSLTIRGGSSAASVKIKDYRLQQHLYLQSRSLQLRQALIERGLTELSHTQRDASVVKPIDWDCALATEENPKSCLYSFDAETGQKVVAPTGTDDWITIQALNRLRRQDPAKIEPLWHGKFLILSTWFSQTSPLTLYTETGFIGSSLSTLLDAPAALGASIAASLFVACLIFWPVLEVLITTFLTAPMLWSQWPRWGRFLHAAFPLKLLIGQWVYKSLASSFTKLYNRIRNILVEWECQMLQDCLPLTILEGGDRDNDDTDFDGEDSTFVSDEEGSDSDY